MKAILIFVLSGLSISSLAQFEFDPGAVLDKLSGPVDSDRPGQAMSPHTCGTMTVQIQTGGAFELWEANTTRSEVVRVPTDIRLGFTKRFELNTRLVYQSIHATNTLTNVEQNNSGLTAPEIGIRLGLLKGESFVPSVGLQSSLSFASGSSMNFQNQMGSFFNLITRNDFDFMTISTNWGLRFIGNGQSGKYYSYVLNFGFPLGDKMSCFVEGFGGLENFSWNVDAGFAYRPINDLQIDFFGGWLGETGPVTNWFAEIGVTWKYSVLKAIAKKKMDSFGIGGKK